MPERRDVYIMSNFLCNIFFHFTNFKVFLQNFVNFVKSTKTLVVFLWFSYPYKGIMRGIF